MKLLIIEDDISLRELMQQYLTKERYIIETAACYSSAIEKISIYHYDCILLDIMLPDGNGFQLLEKLQELHKKECVIIISARDSLDDKIEGLNLGADDYLAKPFHLAELSARIKSVIRRNNKNKEAIQVGNIHLIPETFQIFVGSQLLELGRKEYDILDYFISRCNHMITKDVLAEAVWGDNIDQSANFDFIYAHIKNIRKKLKEANATAEIKAIYGFGYKMVEHQTVDLEPDKQ